MNKCFFCDNRDTLTDLAFRSVKVQCCVTSPPYFGLRSYLPDTVRLRDDIGDDDKAAVLKELAALGILPISVDV